MKPDRMRRVDESMREVLSEVIGQELKDPRIGFVTVTAVRTSSDLTHARVLVSVFGEQRQESIDGLRSSVGYLQKRVGQELNFKNTPQLSIELDETLDRAERIEKILGQDQPRPATHNGDPEPEKMNPDVDDSGSS